MDQFPERLIPPCHSFLLLVFLAEFPFGAWMLFHIIQVIQPLFSTSLPTTLSVSNDADSIPPPSNHPGSTGAGPRQMTEDEMAGWHHRLDGREFE